jgi:hypothetical protein
MEMQMYMERLLRWFLSQIWNEVGFYGPQKVENAGFQLQTQFSEAVNFLRTLSKKNLIRGLISDYTFVIYNL